MAYVIIVAKLKPAWAPPLSAKERQVDLPALTSALPAGTRDYAPLRLLNALKGRRNADVPLAHVLRQLAVVVLPGLLFLLLATSTWQAVTKVPTEQAVELQAIGSEGSGAESSDSGLAEPPAEDELQEPPTEDARRAAERCARHPGHRPAPRSMPRPSRRPPACRAPGPAPRPRCRRRSPGRHAAGAHLVVGRDGVLGACRPVLPVPQLRPAGNLQDAAGSFFPLMILILAVLGSIVFGLARRPAAAMGSLGAFCWRRPTAADHGRCASRST